MTIEDAANALVWWLAHCPGVAFIAGALGREVGPYHYRLAIDQVQPEQKRRVFEVSPLDVPDCYEIKEVA